MRVEKGHTFCLDLFALGKGEVGGEEVVAVSVQRGRHLGESTRDSSGQLAL